MRHQPSLDCRAPRRQQRRPEPKTLPCRAPSPDMAEHEPKHWQPCEVNFVTVVAEGDVVAKPAGDLGRVSHTTNPRQSDHVVKRPAILGPEPDLFAQASRYQ